MGSSGYKSEKRKITDQEMIIASKSICKISISNSQKITSGFLIKFFKNNEDFFCLMTNSNFISNEMINKRERINIFYDNEKMLKEITLNPNERFIKNFNDIGLDEIVIEIIPKDNIIKENFLLPVIDYIYENKNLINKEIIIMQNNYYYTGKIKQINNNEFTYLNNTEKYFSGIPIFLKDNIKVIGINKNNTNNNDKENIAELIGPIFNYFKNFSHKNLENIKDKEYTIDDITDLITEDKSIEKDLEIIENTEEINDGNFINGKLEGNGKFIWKNGQYYIGQFKNGKKHGKGIIYYKNGNIMYEGDFINDKREGNGKLILKNGQYYIGEFKNNKKHGKGIEYNNKGNIIYEGDYVNGKVEGSGKLVLKNGEYYIGQFKNGKRNGKGIVYYKNGSIKCSTNI